jgi:glycosyltransferase involved in cell wall biosynthesis
MKGPSIAIVSREYPPFFGGGIGTYTEQFSRALAGAGHRVAVVTVSDNGAEQREERDGVVVVRLPFLSGTDWSGPHPAIASEDAVAAFAQFSPVSVFAMQVARALPRLVDEFGIDVIEAPDTGALAWFALNDRRLGKACGRKGWPAFVTHLHSPTAWIERWDRAIPTGRAHAELKGMERDVVQWADAVLCPSRGLAHWAEGHFALKRGAVEVIPYPLGSLEVQPPHRERRGRGPRRILYAGRLEPRKGIDVLLAGFARAVEHGADLRLDLAGRDIVDGRTGHPFGARCLERLVPPAARDRITVHGPLEPAAVASLRRTADFAAAPAANDNFPYSCMEAMASGLPVIAARAGGMAEMISGEGDGLLFEPGDVEGCAAVLQQAAQMDVPALEAMSLEARARIQSLCRTPNVIQQRIAHFERVIATSRCPALTHRTEPVVVIGSAEAATQLQDAVTAGAAFAHGWVRGVHGMRVFGTPTLEGLAAAPRDIGPLAVATSALARLGPVNWRSPWELAVALATAGEAGTTVPTHIANSPGGCTAKGLWPEARGPAAVRLCMELGPALVGALASTTGASAHAEPNPAAHWQSRAHAAEAQLATIHASRGWRLLTQIYALLHILRGRPRSGSRP